MQKQRNFYFIISPPISAVVRPFLLLLMYVESCCQKLVFAPVILGVERSNREKSQNIDFQKQTT